MLLTILNGFVVVCGMTAGFMVGRPEEWRKWGYLVGLSAQPAWLYISSQTGTWSISILTVVYTCTWSQGVWFHLIKPFLDSRRED